MKKSVVDTVIAQPPALLVGVVSLVIFFVGGVWWLMQPDYVQVYSGGSDSSHAEVARQLSSDGISYRLGKDGAIEVKDEDVSKARSALVSAGLPAEKAKGYELFDNSDYGMSEFAQKINYQRALEGELVRSLMGLQEIKFARVHLMLRKTSLYGSQQDGSKASVVLQLRPGMRLDRKQISGVQQLVASSVDGLQPEAVVVIDESGQPLNSDGYAAFDERWQISSRIESELQAKAQSVLDRAYGLNNAHASVRVQMNFDRVRAVSDLPVSVDGNGGGIVVREKQQQSYDNKKSLEPADAGGREQHADEIEYAVGKSHSETEYSPGRIERISVGIVMSDALANVDAKALNDVLSATLGLNEQRGDRLSVAYMPLVAMTVSPPETASSSMPVALAGKAEATIPSWVWLLVAVLAASVILLAVLVLTRRQLSAKSQEPARLSGSEREKLLQDVRHWLDAPGREELS